MIVGIDLRCLPADGSAGAGVAHAARFLTYELLALKAPWSWRLYVPKGSNFEIRLPAGKAGNSKFEIICLQTASGSALRAAIQSHPCDILFVPGGSIAPGLKIPCIPWVHDVAIFDHAEWFAQSFLRRRVTTALFERGVKSAPLIFAVSEDTKRALINKFDLDPARIRVTYEGGDPILATLQDEELVEKKRVAKKTLAALGLTNAFVLILGTVEPRKNIAMLIQAWHDAIPSFNRAVDLVVAGKGGWKMKEIMAGQHLHRLAVLDDEARRNLLLAADMVALPSLHEGFGLVALEAMQAGTALLASRAGALPEVVGEDGVLLDPKDHAAWSKALTGLINDETTRVRLARGGKKYSKKFSWQKSAEIIVGGIENLGRIKK
jgi:alpha-1,3-rhamnosyl/mannosyltransferase